MQLAGRPPAGRCRTASPAGGGTRGVRPDQRGVPCRSPRFGGPGRQEEVVLVLPVAPCGSIPRIGDQPSRADRDQLYSKGIQDRRSGPIGPDNFRRAEPSFHLLKKKLCFLSRAL